MASKTPIYEVSRPRKRRSYPYRLPLGAFACILIWFFAILLDKDEKPTYQLQPESLPFAAATSTPFKLYDFQSKNLDEQSLETEIVNAIHYYGLVTREAAQPVAEAHILLPDSFSYQSFVKIIKTSRAENLLLAFGEDKQLILFARE